MTQKEKIKLEMKNLQYEQSHFGACTTAGKTDQEIAHIDERFFWLVKSWNHSKQA
ncbi:hypothetical protein [Acinetobacter sp. CFCC 10889]|uniref:hypothetical protein n=1 Tax=Acinetobacter sp. CFCC 10889 TaxID=1775557 RepID=UPI001D1864E0|nr:hypothetical protein [Acinetobacter sp. CFCC 10889]